MFFKKEYLKYNIAFGLLFIVLLISASLAFSHGGKHAPGEFTNLQALKEATKLYDQLIGKGKLDQSWENKVVSFQRASGEPKAVYIFFDSGGKYSGSNFTGD
jgi:hypothetical protein